MTAGKPVTPAPIEANPPQRAAVPAHPVKRSFRIRGHATSISLEQPFWDLLQAAARGHDVTTAELVTRIDTDRGQTNLSSAVRVWLLNHALSLSKIAEDKNAL